jgi:hypothetical protein
MSAANAALSFDDIIARGMPWAFVGALLVYMSDFACLIDRKRREHEALAKEIFGKNRRSSDEGQNANRRTAQMPSLASRTGIAKVYH